MPVILSFGRLTYQHRRVLEPRTLRKLETAARKSPDRLRAQISVDPDFGP